jgi:hypothetical protein
MKLMEIDRKIRENQKSRIKNKSKKMERFRKEKQV